MPEEFALFFLLGLPSTLIRYENGGFWKGSSNRMNLKTSALRFSVDRKHFENEAFRKRRDCDLFPARVLLKHKSKLTGDCCVSKFLRRSVDAA